MQRRVELAEELFPCIAGRKGHEGWLCSLYRRAIAKLFE